MLKLFQKVPNYVYLASIIGGAAVAYILYPIKKQKKKTINGNPRGLINCKNDCFINVILQSLAASDKVTNWLITNTTNSNSLFDTLANIIISINRLENTQQANLQIENLDEFEFYAAQGFKRALNAHNWSIKSEEHDCYELFQLIIDVLDEEKAESKKSLKSLNYFVPSHLKENSRSEPEKNPFHGYFVNQLQCLDCNHKYPLKLESFYSLSLTLPNHEQGLRKNSITLAECINNYFKTDYIEGMKCEKCSSNENSQGNKLRKGFIKRQAIAKLPDCLSIQIQRNCWSEYGYEMVKKTSYVQFPETIRIDSNAMEKRKENNLTSLLEQYSNNEFSLKQFGIGGLLGGRSLKTKTTKINKNFKKSSILLNQSEQEQNTQQYELKSAIVHYGNAYSGHFVTYRRPLKSMSTTTDKNWLKISDCDIRRCKDYQLFSSNVYMLFYDKTNKTVA